MQLVLIAQEGATKLWNPETCELIRRLNKDEKTTYPGGELKPVQRTGAMWNHLAPLDPKHIPVGEWNSVSLLCRENLHQVTLNGKRIADVRRSDPVIRPTGCIAISNWKGQSEDCDFRNARIRRLGKECSS